MRGRGGRERAWSLAVMLVDEAVLLDELIAGAVVVRLHVAVPAVAKTGHWAAPITLGVACVRICVCVVRIDGVEDVAG